MKKKILYISGTRADYGLMRSALFGINRCPEFQLEIAATGMHLMPEFGNSIGEIIEDNFIVHRIDAVTEHDTRDSMSMFIGQVIIRLTEKVKDIRPDLLLLLGDRGEMLAGAIVGTYVGIPVAHLHGGEITSTVDEPVRHAITKLAHFHLAATQRSAERIVLMGEDPARVFVVGAPGLDAILHGAFTPAEVLKERYSLDLTAPLVLCVQHPVSSETESAPAQMQETLAALTELKYQTIIIYPNADAGGRQMINVIRNYEKLPFIRSYKNIPHEDYLGLLRISSVLVGNSSSGIIEAPSFHVPVVNIGSRQQGRERGCNVTDTGYDRRDIIRAVRRSLHDEQYRKDVDGCCNPYGDGTASDKIIRFLKIIDLTNFDTQKQLQYD